MVILADWFITCRSRRCFLGSRANYSNKHSLTWIRNSTRSILVWSIQDFRLRVPYLDRNVGTQYRWYNSPKISESWIVIIVSYIDPVSMDHRNDPLIGICIIICFSFFFQGKLRLHFWYHLVTAARTLWWGIRNVCFWVRSCFCAAICWVCVNVPVSVVVGPSLEAPLVVICENNGLSVGV